MNFAVKLLRNMLERTSIFVGRNPRLRRLRHLIEATDEFFFGTDKTTLFAPHILDGIDIKRYMSFVIIGLLPATLAAVYFYGLRVLVIIGISYAFGGVVEVLFSTIRRKPIHEGFLVTGLIFPLILPPTIPLWMAAVGVMFGVFFGKEVFGGTGRNIFNPALVGRVFLSLAFPEQFATMWQEPFLKGWGGFIQYTSDAVTSATPLINFKSNHVLTGLSPLLFGITPGSIGEVFRIGIIAGGIFLIATKIADWRIPFSYLLSVFIFSFFTKNIASGNFAPPLFQLLSGGLLLGAFFMATDPISAPFMLSGRWVYGALLGILTVLIRALSGFVEGVMFAILIMNAVAPLIDTIILNFQYRKYRL